MDLHGGPQMFQTTKQKESSGKCILPYAPNGNWNIYLHEWPKSMANVSINIQYMEHLEYEFIVFGPCENSRYHHQDTALAVLPLAACSAADKLAFPGGIDMIYDTMDHIEQ